LRPLSLSPLSIMPCRADSEQRRDSAQIASIEASQALGLFACGSYELNEETGQRSGKLSLHAASSGEVVCETDAALGLAGVLDMKWRPDGSLTVALADGRLSVYSVVEGESSGSGEGEAEGGGAQPQRSLALLASASEPEEGLFLSVDVSAAADAASFVSTQAGSLLHFAAREGGEMALLNRRADAHRMLGENVPAWIVAADPFHAHTLLSGGDDMCTRLWDLRALGASTAANSKAHSAGVTSAMFSPYFEHLVAVGSYDESITLWDVRAMRQPVETVHAGGGVWRIKWHPRVEHASVILAGCMHGGAAIFRLQSQAQAQAQAQPDTGAEAAAETGLRPGMAAGMVAGAETEAAEGCYAGTAHEDVLRHPLCAGDKMLAYGVDWYPELDQNPFKFLSSSFYEKYYDVVSFV
jgi:hypothetical protein